MIASAWRKEANWLLRGDDIEPAPSDVPPDVTEEFARLLQEHFATPPPARWRGDRAAGEPPSRLVFLLEHEYTERGLDWAHLKGRDAARALPVWDIARRVGCDAVRALAKVHETWSTIESDGGDRWYGRRRSGGWSERTALKPYAAEYEGNMGDHGSTLDRWYRRGAVLLWPKAKTLRRAGRGRPGLGPHRDLDAPSRPGDRGGQ